MKMTLRIPKGGVPPWRAPPIPDTVWHRRARMGLFVALGLVYVILAIGAFRGGDILTWGKGTWYGMLLLAGIPIIDQSVRPGKGRFFLAAFVLLVLMYLFPTFSIVLFFFPVVFVFVMIYRSIRRKPMPGSRSVSD
jgi:hypothetical protein